MSGIQLLIYAAGPPRWNIPFLGGWALPGGTFPMGAVLGAPIAYSAEPAGPRPGPQAGAMSQ